MEDKEKNKDELLKEVKELRKEITEDNKKKQQNSAYNSMIFIGAGLIFLVIIVWWLARSCGIL